MKRRKILKDCEDVRKLIETIETGDFKRLEFVGSGSNSTVYGYKNLVAKVYTHWHNFDGENLETLSGSPYYPEVFAYEKGSYAIMQRVEGTLLNRYEGEVSGKYLRSALDFAYAKGLIPEDVHDENIIVNAAGVPVIIDVGHFCENEHVREDEASNYIDSIIASLWEPDALYKISA